MNKKVSIGFGFLAVILIALLVIPKFIDLNKWKPEIERQVSTALGREIHIEGNLSLSILPSPNVTLHNVRLDNANWASTPNMLKVKEIGVTLSLFPLLTKSIELSQVNLIAPEINLEVAKDGKTNWDFLTSSQKESDTETDSVPEDKVSVSWAIKETIPRINIQQGALTYTEGEKIYHVTDFQTTVKSHSPQGPFVIEGYLQAEKHGIKYQGNIGEMTKGQPVKIDTHLTAEGQRLQVLGSVDLVARQFTGKIASKMKPSELGIENIPIKEELTVTSDVSATEKEIKLSNLTITNKTFKAEGTANLSLAEVITYDVVLKGLPGQTNLMMKGPLNNGGDLKGSIQLASKDLPIFITWIQPEFKHPIPAKTIDLKTSYILEKEQTRLTDIVLDLAGRKLTGSVDIKLPQVKTNISTPDLTAWLSLLEIDSPKALGNAHLMGTLVLKEQVDLNIELGFAGGHIKSDGQVTPLSKVYDLNLDLSYPDLPSLLKAMDFDSGLNLGVAKLKLHLTGTPQKIAFENLNGSFGPSGTATSISGQGGIDLSGAKPIISADIRLGNLTVDKLLAQAPDQQAPKIMLASTRQPAATTSFKGWSKEKINSAFLNSCDADIKLQASSITFDKFSLHKVSLPLKLSQGVVSLKDIKGTIYGGALTGQAKLRGGSNLQTDLDLTLDKANLEQVVTTIAGRKIKGGTMDASISISTSGASQHELVSGLKGNASVKAYNGQLLGFDVNDIVRKIKTVTNPTALFNLFERSSGSTSFAEIDVKSTITNGIAKIDTLTIQAPSLSGQGAGQVNLVVSTVDMTIDTELKDLEKAPKFRVNIVGPLDNPQIKYDLSSLSNYIFQEAGRGVINRFLGGAAVGAIGGPAGAVIGGILGLKIPGTTEDDKKTEPAETEQPKDEEVSPGKAIEGLIKGLF